MSLSGVVCGRAKGYSSIITPAWLRTKLKACPLPRKIPFDLSRQSVTRNNELYRFPERIDTVPVLSLHSPLNLNTIVLSSCPLSPHCPQSPHSINFSIPFHRSALKKRREKKRKSVFSADVRDNVHSDSYLVPLPR